MLLLILLQFMQYLVSFHVQILSLLGMLVVGGGGLLHQLIRTSLFIQGNLSFSSVVRWSDPDFLLLQTVGLINLGTWDKGAAEIFAVLFLFVSRLGWGTSFAK